MTEQEWNTCADPQPMLEFLRGKASDRKLRLFGIVLSRQIRFSMPPAFQEAIVLAEEYADGHANENDLDRIIHRVPTRAGVERLPYWHREELAWAATRNCLTVQFDPSEVSPFVAQAAAQSEEASARSYLATLRSERLVHAGLLREIFGNPFHPASIDPSWLAWNNGTVRHLAQAIYEERAFDRMPILADALEDAGCTNQEILAHCRGPGPHCRGCWVVDLLLGKE